MLRAKRPPCKRGAVVQNEERQAAVAASGGAGRPTEAQLKALQLETQYVELFLMKYICPTGDCNGTMTPVSDADGGTLRCNVCSYQRSEEQFLQEVETLMRSQQATE